MKRIIATLAACGALLAGGGSSQAVTKDPVQALGALLASGRGVHFTEVTTLSGGGQRVERRRTGVFEFHAKGGVKALDVTTTGGEHGRERAIGFNHEVGGTSYQSEGFVGKWLKEGNVWWEDSHPFHLWHTDILGYDEQLVNPTEPATLAALLKNGNQRGKTVTGVITFKKLEQASLWAQHTAHISWGSATKLSYTITLNSRNLVSGIRSTFTFAEGLDELVGKTLHVDTRYSRWGGKVSIVAPDPRKTTTELCIEGICNWRLPS